MQERVGDVEVHFSAHGDGVPLLALHGAGVDHRELEAALEPVLPHEGYRRVYLDLPGMGRTTADGLTSNDDVVALLVTFVETVIGGPALLLGHSYGAYLARGVAARRPDLVRGLALVCPVGGTSADVPTQVAVREDDDAHDGLDALQRKGFDEYFVVRTAATAHRYRDAVWPSTQAVDEEALGRVFAGWAVDLDGEPYDGPTLLVAGRQDSTVGSAGTVALLERYPHATLAVVDGAGHALPHERPEVLGPLLAHWLTRVDEPA
ncbi:alpha/beta hydrolase [Angustibacter peucedani]